MERIWFSSHAVSGTKAKAFKWRRQAFPPEMKN